MTGLPASVDAARRLRKVMSLPEVLLWRELRRRPERVKFRRQHAVGDYIIDFFCAAGKLAVEIDGRSHDAGDRPARDARRDAWLAERGVQLIRINAKRVLDDPTGTADWLARIAAASPVAPPLHHRKSDGPPPRSGEDQGHPSCR